MAVKRKVYELDNRRVIQVEEYHDGRYGGAGKKREKKIKPTPEQMKKNNMREKIKRCQMRLLEYFDEGDLWATWTYRKNNRPASMKEALKEFQQAIRIVRREFKKRGFELRWIRNIEKGTKGAWHIHLVIKEIGDTASIIQQAWPYGATWSCTLKHSEMYGEDFAKLAAYMTKNEESMEQKKDGKPAQPRIREANYGTSRNMPLPEPKVDKLVRWKSEPKPKKGYYISNNYEGINPVTGYKFRRYTMIRLERKENAASEYLHRDRQQSA